MLLTYTTLLKAMELEQAAQPQQMVVVLMQVIAVQIHLLTKEVSLIVIQLEQIAVMQIHQIHYL
jgi:hypothetical protein